LTGSATHCRGDQAQVSEVVQDWQRSGKIRRLWARDASLWTGAGEKDTITSGRHPSGMKMLIEALPLEQPISAFIGGLFVRPDLSIVRERAATFVTSSNSEEGFANAMERFVLRADVA
jgi:hypothetical protein